VVGVDPVLGGGTITRAAPGAQPVLPRAGGDRWPGSSARGHGRECSSRVDVDGVTRRLTALTDGAAIQVLTGAPGMTVTVMRELLVEFVSRELIPPGTDPPELIPPRNRVG